MSFWSKPKTSRLKSSEHGAQGLLPTQSSEPDCRSSSFEAEAHLQSQAVATSVEAAEDQAFIDAVSDRREG